MFLSKKLDGNAWKRVENDTQICCMVRHTVEHLVTS